MSLPVPRAIAFALLWLLSLNGAPLQADPVYSGSLKPDLRLLIDISGSMKESDPDNLRGPALDLIVRLLPDGARAGVWIFGQDVDILVPHGVVDADWRAQAAAAVAEIDNSGLRTNIPAALAAATWDLGSMDPRYRTSVVLLTDGKVDVAESPMANAAAARKLLEITVPELGATGIPVHTIALSAEADWGFLRSLAQATAGIAEQASSADQLTAIFLQALEMVAPTARVPVSGGKFLIDDSVREFTALLFYGEQPAKVRLLGPGEQRLRPEDAVDGVSWFSNRKFALVTVVGPQPGSWQLEAPDGVRARVTVLSNLELEVDPLPNSLPGDRASELGIRLRQRGELISSAELLSIFDLAVVIRAPDGKKTRINVSETHPPPATGEYRVPIPPLQSAGRYTVTARVETPTLQRELPMYVEVIAPPSREVISTRALDVPMEDLRVPAITLGVLALVALALVFWILRRRRQRKLELWQRRFRQAAEADVALPDGLTAEPRAPGDAP